MSTIWLTYGGLTRKTRIGPAAVKVTESRAAVDFAACIRELTDINFPISERIRVVLDNLSTRSASALYQAFPPPKRDACCAG